MKPTLTLLLLLCLSVPGFSQDQDYAAKFKRDFYLERSANQKKAGLILLGSGTAAIVIGAVGFDSTWDSGSATSTDAFGFVLLAGVVADLVSIPLLVSSGINKRKAQKISLSLFDQNQYPLPNNLPSQKIQPIFSLRINLGS